tara:strand:+ start:6536 stop:7882 length:1347 start_codon:yes stop_codon:yes gene_type:complete
MLKHNFLIISILFFIACDSDKTTILSGKIVKPTNNKIQLLKDEVLVNEILIDENGTFKSLIDIDKNGLFNFFHPPEFQYLIINKGDSLVLRLNSLDFDESLIFSGKGSAKNNYLINVFLKHEQEEEYLRKRYSSSNIRFKTIIDSLFNIKTTDFKNFKTKIKLDKTSELIIDNAISLPLLSHIENYILINKNNHDYNINFFSNYRKFSDYNINELSHFKPYLDYIIVKSINESFELNSEFDYSVNFNIKRLEYINDLITNDVIKNKLLRFIAYEYLLEEKLLINIDTFINFFEKISTNLNTNIEINELYDNLAALQIGKLIPDLELMERNGSVKRIRNINNSKNVYLFWSYDQNAHQVNLFKKVNSLSIKHLDFNFYLININDDYNKWIFNLINQFPQQNVKNFKSVDFENMSKKMVLNNLNKVITTNMGVISNVLSITELEEFLETN